MQFLEDRVGTARDLRLIKGDHSTLFPHHSRQGSPEHPDSLSLTLHQLQSTVYCHSSEMQTE